MGGAAFAYPPDPLPAQREGGFYLAGRFSSRLRLENLPYILFTLCPYPHTRRLAHTMAHTARAPPVPLSPARRSGREGKHGHQGGFCGGEAAAESPLYKFRLSPASGEGPGVGRGALTTHCALCVTRTRTGKGMGALSISVLVRTPYPCEPLPLPARSGRRGGWARTCAIKRKVANFGHNPSTSACVF
jgi:hypothetical protein